MHDDAYTGTPLNTESADENAAFLYDLTPVEVRVLACLVEKELTTQDQYPLTENSVKLACNQKSNREPVMKIETGEVIRTLSHLSDKGWVKIDYGSRANKYKHCMRTQLGVDKAQSAIMSVLCLRGAQTLSELKTRTERALQHDDEAFQTAFDALLALRTPLIEQCERQSGQREDRFIQRAFEQQIAMASSASTTNAVLEVSNLDGDRLEALEAKVEDLLARVTELESSQ
ncbi:MAG: DUF480 domain-containing protein [Pseudomonadota bacterium]